LFNPHKSEYTVYKQWYWVKFMYKDKYCTFTQTKHYFLKHEKTTIT